MRFQHLFLYHAVTDCSKSVLRASMKSFQFKGGRHKNPAQSNTTQRQSSANRPREFLNQADIKKNVKEYENQKEREKKGGDGFLVCLVCLDRNVQPSAALSTPGKTGPVQ